MHEESITIGQDGKYHLEIGTDRDGKKGQRLSPMFPFEKEEYDTEEEANEMAAKRSDAFGRLLDESRARHSGFEQLMRDTAGTWTRPR
jgi:hypothetical protein